MEKIFLNTKELAGVLGVSPKTIRNWMYEGRFPLKPVKQGGRQNFWYVPDVYAYAESIRWAS